MDDTELKTLLLEQVDEGVIIQEFINNSKTRGGERNSLAVWRSRKELLASYWDSFRIRHRLLSQYKSQLKDAPYFKDNQYFDIEQCYVETLAELQPLTQTNETVNHQVTLPLNQPPTNSLASLPKVPLPKFSGKQLEWENFKEMFEARVKNVDSIDPVIKLQHLMSCLEGDAARRLNNIQIVGTNLNVAWDILVRRYDNKRVRLFAQLNRLITAPAVNPKASGEITRLLDTFEENIRALRTLERAVDS